MSKSVIELQNAFQSIVNSLQKNRRVLAIFTFGSIVSGDIWEESDIDLFIIYENGFPIVRDVYSESLGIAVHSRLLDRDAFLKLNENIDTKIRNLLISSKLVFCRDNEISNIYNKARYSIGINSSKSNLVYLGRLLKDLGISKKYLQRNVLSTSYEVLIRALDSFSKLLINLSGYTVSKDSLTMATNINSEFKDVIRNLFTKSLSKESIEETINYINKYIDMNIIIASDILISYLREQGDFVSAFEILNDNEFKKFNIKIEQILKELYRRKIIVKKKRAFKDEDGNKILDENVYSVLR